MTSRTRPNINWHKPFRKLDHAVVHAYPAHRQDLVSS
jgi:hypothetical protein